MVEVVKPGKVAGSVLIPASKAHTIRALLIASLAEGTSRILNPLDSADTRSCINACRLLGARISGGEEGGVCSFIVDGVGGRVRVPEGPIDVGNSGTTLYLAAGIAATAAADISFTGDGQIRSRPAANLLRSLQDLGVRVVSESGGRPPFTLRGPLRGGRTRIECPTSQYLSSLLIAAPLAPEATEIQVPLLNERPYVEMTLRWLEEQGIRLERRGLEYFRIPGGQRYRAFTKAVPGDFSSATFFLCAAAVTGSTLTLRGLDMGDSQGDKEVVNILARMGCSVSIAEDEIRISGGPLRGMDIPMNAIPDALPALAAVAGYARGRTRLLGAPQARLKETDRIAVMAAELTKMGVRVRELPDGLEIFGPGAGVPGAGDLGVQAPGNGVPGAGDLGAQAPGNGIPGAGTPEPAPPLRGAELDGRGDHRVVMALAVAALGASGESRIKTAEAAEITFPGFFPLLEKTRIAP